MTILEIESLTHDGRGIGRIEGKAVFVDQAIPGDVVEIQITRHQKNYDEALLKRIIHPSSHRIVPFCPVYQNCGGCQLQHANIDAQRKWKSTHFIQALMKSVDGSECTVVPPLASSDQNYRRRARFIYGRNQGESSPKMGFRASGTNQIVDIEQCPVLTKALNHALSEKRTQILSQGSRNLKEITAVDTGQEVVWSDQCQQARYQVGGLDFIFPTSGFVQVNADINQKMILQALDWLNLESDHRVLDLFCGVGNFTLPIAQQAKQVTGIEGESDLLSFADQNAESNQINNAVFFKADLFNDVAGLSWFRQQSYDRILLDPGRLGALQICKVLGRLKAQTIVYVSCNASTLIRDVKELQKQGYRLRKAGFMDMFPHTSHAEVMVQLIKEKGNINSKQNRKVFKM